MVTVRQRVERALAGDDDAMDEVVADWLPTVYSWCARLGRPHVDPEEAAHDVLLTLIRRRATVGSPAQLAPWLFGVTRRIVANHRRRAWWRRWWPGTAEEPVTNDTPEAHLERARLAERIDRALESLPTAHREVLVLCYLEERPLAEAAALLGVPEGTVKSRLFHARGKFQVAFGAEP